MQIRMGVVFLMEGATMERSFHQRAPVRNGSREQWIPLQLQAPALRLRVVGPVARERGNRGVQSCPLSVGNAVPNRRDLWPRFGLVPLSFGDANERA
jgi:hypothetical protein